MSAESLAILFHETYERLAPSFSYETRKESAVPWEQVPEKNRLLMIAVAGEVLSQVQHELVGRLVPELESEFNLDPCPAISMAERIAGRVVGT